MPAAGLASAGGREGKEGGSDRSLRRVISAPYTPEGPLAWPWPHSPFWKSVGDEVVKGPVHVWTPLGGPRSRPEARLPAGPLLPPGLSRGRCLRQPGAGSARPWGWSASVPNPDFVRETLVCPSGGSGPPLSGSLRMGPELHAAGPCASAVWEDEVSPRKAAGLSVCASELRGGGAGAVGGAEAASLSGHGCEWAGQAVTESGSSQAAVPVGASEGMRAQ